VDNGVVYDLISERDRWTDFKFHFLTQHKGDLAIFR